MHIPLRVMLTAMACLVLSPVFADEELLTDFTRSGEGPGAAAGGIWNPRDWKIVYLPSGKQAEAASITVRAGALEAVIDYARAPVATIGAAILAPEVRPGVPGFTQSLAGRGLIGNVGALKQVSMSVSASEQGTGVALILGDEKAQETALFFGTVLTEARRVTWVNRDYIADVRRLEMTPAPVTAADFPYRRIIGVVCTRPNPGADKATIRIGRTAMVYDRAFLDDEEARLALEPW